MERQTYILCTALQQLVRGGQRNAVAFLCVVFGVMSLVAMSLLSASIEQTMILSPAEMLGGDASLGRTSENTISEENLAELQTLQDAGDISQYTAVAYSSSVMFHKPDSGEMHFAGAGMGVDPSVYPLAGNLTISQPGNTGLASLLQEVGDVVVTQDIANDQQLSLGTAIILADLHSGTPVQGRVRGIASDTPNHQGSKIYYNLETASRLAGGQAVINTVLINTKNIDHFAGNMEKEGWHFTTARGLAESQRDTTNLISNMLHGAGILGLLVGGIGISNTMQVLLRRRRREVAVWKTLGYQEKDLQAMFVFEAAALGFSGSLFGAGLGVLVSTQLVDIFRRTGNLLFNWAFSPYPVALGVLVGLLTTVVFAAWAIVSASRAEPMALLRNEPIEIRQLPWWKSFGLAICLLLPFIGVVSLAMGSLMTGLIVLGVACAGLLILGGLFGGLVWLFARIIPLRRLPLLSLTQNSLRHRSFSMVFGMIALFVGILAMTFGIIITGNAQEEMSKRSIPENGTNITILAPADQGQAIHMALQSQGNPRSSVTYVSPVQSVRLAGSQETINGEPELLGVSDPADYEIQGAEWNSQPEGVYLPAWSDVPVESQIEISLTDGSTRTLKVVGTYNQNYNPMRLSTDNGLLMKAEQSTQIAPPSQVRYSVQIPPAELSETANMLGTALPGATVIDLVRYATRFIQTYRNLFTLAVSMSSLAMLAGVLLVANTVSLAMLERRYELGVLKAIGYSRRHIVIALVSEYSFAALVATLMGIVAGQLYLVVLSMSNHLAATALALKPFTALVVISCSVGLVLLTVVGVTWNPLKASPVTTLNERV